MKNDFKQSEVEFINLPRALARCWSCSYIFITLLMNKVMSLAIWEHGVTILFFLFCGFDTFVTHPFNLWSVFIFLRILCILQDIYKETWNTKSISTAQCCEQWKGTWFTRQRDPSCRKIIFDSGQERMFGFTFSVCSLHQCWVGIKFWAYQ